MYYHQQWFHTKLRCSTEGYKLNIYTMTTYILDTRILLTLCMLVEWQVERAATEDGRKPSIWDTFAHAGKYISSKYSYRFLEFDLYNLKVPLLCLQDSAPIRPHETQLQTSIINTR